MVEREGIDKLAENKYQSSKHLYYRNDTNQSLPNSCKRNTDCLKFSLPSSLLVF